MEYGNGENKVDVGCISKAVNGETTTSSPLLEAWSFFQLGLDLRG